MEMDWLLLALLRCVMFNITFSTLQLESEIGAGQCRYSKLCHKLFRLRVLKDKLMYCLSIIHRYCDIPVGASIKTTIITVSFILRL